MAKKYNAFHGQASVKAKYMKRVVAHFKADEITQGIYWSEGRGCAVGCTLHSERHKDYEKELGLPHSVARLEDALFEAQPCEDSKYFPVKFLKAIKPGADLSKVADLFAIEVLINKDFGLITQTNDEETQEQIKQLAKLLKIKVETGKFNKKNFAKIAGEIGDYLDCAAFFSQIVVGYDYDKFENSIFRQLDIFDWLEHSDLEYSLPEHLSDWFDDKSLKAIKIAADKFLSILKSESERTAPKLEVVIGKTPIADIDPEDLKPKELLLA